MQFEFIETDRLQLRLCNNDVLQYVHQNYNENELMIFFGLNDRTDLIKEVVRFEKGLQTFNKDFLYFHLIDKTSKRVIGWCGYHTWYLDHRRAEIGYVMDNINYRNQFLMSEAIKSILEYGFDQMALHRVEAFVEPENNPSLKLLHRFGFKKEGHLKEHYFRNGIAEDSLVFALLKKDRS